jgi:hypothetical protein
VTGVKSAVVVATDEAMLMAYDAIGCMVIHPLYSAADLDGTPYILPSAGLQAH